MHSRIRSTDFDDFEKKILGLLKELILLYVTIKFLNKEIVF